MTFDLKISFKEFELKSGLIDLKTFLNLNTYITDSIQNICSYSHYVNFAETIIDGFQICGSINRIFNHKRFINSLKHFQEKKIKHLGLVISYIEIKLIHLFFMHLSLN